MSEEKFDTIIVPAHQEGFEDTFLAKNCWYAIRIDEDKHDNIQYIAVYRTAPVSAITHFAPVASIEQYEDTDKYIIYFTENAKRMASPITGGKKLKHLQNTKYTSIAKMLVAKSLDDL